MPAFSLYRSPEKHQRGYMPLTETASLKSQEGQSCDHTASASRSRLLQTLAAFVAGATLTSIFFVLMLKAQVQASQESKVVSVEVSSIRSPVPHIPLTNVVFRENTTFTARPSPETDREWNNLLPPGRGFVFIDNPEQYGLEPGQETKWGEIFSVSLFHQLHCLGQMRKAYWTLIDGVVSGDTRKSKLLVGPHGEHVKHCFDYLRQSIMCAGDMTMEWPRTEPDDKRYAVDGWNIPHQCKSWDAISEYMQKARFNNSMRSDIVG